MPNAPSRQRFVHRPLDLNNHPLGAIRLISVLGSLSPDGLLKCRIRQTSTNSHYQCLSYRWGSSQPSQRVVLEDSGDEKYFEVGQNLHNFLRNVYESAKENVGIQKSMEGTYWTGFGSPFEDSILGNEFWIDAMCINQQDDQERSEQVKRMGDLYGSADRVIIWLDSFQNPSIFAGSVKELVLDPKGACGHKDSGDVKLQLDHLLKILCEDEYWTGAWIVQEITLNSRTFVLRNAELIPLDIFVRRLEFWDAPSKFSRLRKTAWPHFFYVLDLLRDQQCSLPHDRIYSILGLGRRSHAIPVDYRLSLAHLAYSFLQEYGPVHCLCSVLLVIASGVHYCSALDLWAHLLSLAPPERVTKRIFSGRGIGVRIHRHGGGNRVVIARLAFWALLPTKGFPRVQCCPTTQGLFQQRVIQVMKFGKSWRIPMV
jgi:hypothetical protein